MAIFDSASLTEGFAFVGAFHAARGTLLVHAACIPLQFAAIFAALDLVRLPLVSSGVQLACVLAAAWLVLGTLVLRASAGQRAPSAWSAWLVPPRALSGFGASGRASPALAALLVGVALGASTLVPHNALSSALDHAAAHASLAHVALVLYVAVLPALDRVLGTLFMLVATPLVVAVLPMHVLPAVRAALPAALAASPFVANALVAAACGAAQVLSHVVFEGALPAFSLIEAFFITPLYVLTVALDALGLVDRRALLLAARAGRVRYTSFSRWRRRVANALGAN